MSTNCGIIDFRDHDAATQTPQVAICPPAPPVCDPCACAYVSQSELLAAFANDAIKASEHNAAFLLAQQVSRLFDSACNLPYGHFSPAGNQAYGRTFRDPQSYFLELPPYLVGSITQVSLDGVVVSPDAYAEINGGLDLLPCQPVGDCCPSTPDCSHVPREPQRLGWNGCVCVVAQWGWGCIPEDVKLAVIAMTLDLFRKLDPTKATALNIAESTAGMMRIPPVWKIAVERHRIQRRIANFAFA